MKVLLIDPPGVQKGLNVGLGYLASSLIDAGHDVSVLDLNNNTVSGEELIEEIKEHAPDVVGFSIKNATYFSAVEMAGKIREEFRDIILVAGGPYVTLAGMEFFDDCDFFDYAIIGEGENTLPRLCKALESGINVKIDGAITRGKSGKEISPVFVEDLDSLPQPGYELISNMEGTMSKFRYPVVTSRGCPYSCIYCSVCFISGRKWRARSIGKVVEEIKEAEKKHRIRGFEIIDDNFTLDVQRAKQFCKTLIKEKINLPWSCPNGIRTDKIDGELADLMVKSGCDLVMVGVESADEKVFAGIKKGETLADIEKGIKILKGAGIRVGGYFIIGLPGDNLKATEKSVEFAEKNKLDPAHFNMLVPYPKTGIWEWIQKNGRMLEDYRTGRHFMGEPGPVFETDDFTAKERKEAYYMANTKLGQYNFIVPSNVSGVRRILGKAMFMWRYDKGRLPRYFYKGLTNRVR